MSSIGQAIRLLREEREWTQEFLAAKVGMHPTGITRRESGKTSIPRNEQKLFAAAFDLTIEEFELHWRSQKVHERPAPGRIPVINRGPAGQVVPYDHSQYAGGEYHDAMEYVDRGDITDPLAFALIIVGDSMEPTLQEGDYVVFAPFHRVPRPSVKLTAGKIVCIRVNHESATGDGVTVGRYRVIDGTDDSPARVLITKDNPRHAPVTLDTERIEQLAVAIEIRTKRGL